MIRQMIADIISETPDMEVAGEASDGQKALALLSTLCPDVLTLDVQMPNMGGLETLDGILAQRPTPVIMVSSLTQRGAATTLEALDRGAIDYVGKPEGGLAGIAALREELPRKIRAVNGLDVRRILEIRRQRKTVRRTVPVEKPAKSAATDAVPANLADKCVALGISTGGPPALASLFEAIRPPMPPIVVVQHMPAHFTKPFAWRLNTLSKLDVKEAEDGDVLRPNNAYVAPGGLHVQLVRQGSLVKIRLRDEPLVSGHKPSVDVMMCSAAKIYGPRCLGVIMTGMGRDGVEGCRTIRDAGGYVLGQDEATSDVYGMNRAAHIEGHVDRQFALPNAAATITRQLAQLARLEPAHAG
jgi:two-component system chemotaxis response regulator CheB